MASNEFLKFKVGELYAALPIARVKEVLPMVALVRPPLGSDLLEGYLDLGGIAVPVLRLDRMLGLEIREWKPSDHIVVLRGGDRPVALLVECALELARVAPAELLSGDSTSFSPAVTAELRGGDHAVHVLDLDRLLDSVARAVNSVTAADQARTVLARAGDAA